MGRGSEMEGVGRGIQILMFAANVVIWIGSIIILVFGIMAMANKPYLEHIFGETIYLSGAAILVSVGVLSFIVAFLGCFGALKEIKCMLLTYFVIVLILFIVLLVGGVLGFVFKGKGADSIKNGMYRSMREYKEGSDDPITTAWDDAQRGMECCGIISNEDWMSNRNFNYNDKRVPQSCCKRNEETYEILDCQLNPGNMWKDTCFQKARDYAKQHAHWVGGAGVAVAVLMVFGLIFSISLFLLIK